MKLDNRILKSITLTVVKHHRLLNIGWLSAILLLHLPAMAQLTKFQKMKEYQLTFDKKGHMLNMTQCFSSDNNWLAYDTRNDDTQIGSTCCIEKINIKTREIVKLYQTGNQTLYGPGVGAVSFSPAEDKLIFIHGLKNADENNPYGVVRRTGVIVNDHLSHYHADARDIIAPFTKGALRGGTHAHSWSADGKMISFTYNDAVMEQLSLKNTDVKDLRTIGVMQPGQTTVNHIGTENNSGNYFAAVVVKVTENPLWGSDEIEKAFDEGWIGRDGYIKEDGSRQKRAIAFQGSIRDSLGKPLTEVFVVNVPDDLTKETPGKAIEGTENTRPNPPANTLQRRVTFTTGLKYPGVQGPRHWLRTSADGRWIYFLMKDDTGIVQVFTVSTNGGKFKQLTKNKYPVQSAFSLSPDDGYLAYTADNSVFITEVATGKTKRITKKSTAGQAPLGGMVWSYDGKTIAYNRFVKDGDEQWLQIFILATH